MTTMPVIPNFNVFKDGRAGSRARGPVMTIEQLPAERRKKALGHRVVMTIGAATHTGRNLVCRQQLTIIGGCILHAPIAVVEPVSYTHLRAHETPEHLVCRLLL